MATATGILVRAMLDEDMDAGVFLQISGFKFHVCLPSVHAGCWPIMIMLDPKCFGVYIYI